MQKMDLLPNKQYLSLNDIIDYLNKQGKEFNIENNYDRQKLYTLIIDYIRERSLNPLFYYNGNVKIELKKYHIFGAEPYEITKVEVNEFNKDINEYLKIIDNSIIDSLLIDNEVQSLQGNRTIKTYQTTTVREKTYFAKPAFYNV